MWKLKHRHRFCRADSGDRMQLAGKKTLLSSAFILKMIILPRQARDKLNIA